MNIRHLSAALLLAITGSASAQFRSKPVEGLENPSSIRVPFGRLLGETGPYYSPTFGLVVWQSEGTELDEVIYHTLPVADGNFVDSVVNPIASAQIQKLLEGSELTDEAKEGARKYIDKRVAKMVANGNLILVSDYVKKHAGNRQLDLRGPHPSAVIMRLRKNFEYMNEDSGEAIFRYVDDKGEPDSSSSYKAALMFDFYTDTWYERERKSPLGWIETAYRFSFRVGAEVDYNDSATAPANIQRYYALATFVANPDMNAKFMNIAGAEITSPQFVQIGARYTRNLIDDTDDIAPIIGWQPRARVDEGMGNNMLNKDGVEAKIPGKPGHFKGFALNQRMYFQRHSFGKLWTGNADDPPRPGEETSVSKYYAFINPDIRLVGANDAEVNLKGKPADIVKALKDYKKATLQWDVDMGLGIKDGICELTAGAHGIHPLSDLEESKIWYTARVDFRLRSWHSQYSYDENGGVKHDSKWAGMTAFISYTKGEAPPTYVDVDRIEAGVGIRF